MKINAEMLRGILDCMHAEADARDKHSAQIRSIVTAAKDKGFDTKAVRKVFVRERMDEAERAKQDDLLETYEGALGGKGRALVAIASGVPAGEAAKANGVHRATVARAQRVAKQASNATPHDPATGEVIDHSEARPESTRLERAEHPEAPARSSGHRAGALNALERGNAKPSRDGEASADERDASASSSPPESCGSTEGRAGQLLAPDCQLAGSEQSQASQTHKDRKTAGTPEMAASGTAGVESGPQDTDDLEIPSFLRRERVAA